MNEHASPPTRQDAPQTLYHYCGMGSFHGIVQNKEIWLSDIYCMNDYMEHTWLVDEAALPTEKRGTRRG